MAVMSFLLLTLFIGITSAQYCSNIHGCTPYELKAELSDRDEDNLYQVLSWDVKDEKVSVICDLVRTLDEIMVINLQQVSRDQLKSLTSSCLKRFNSTHSVNKIRSRNENLFNPIFYRDDNTILKKIKTGTTTSSDGKCKSLTWVQLSLHVTKPSSYRRRRPRLNKRSLAANLFAILSGKKTYRKIRHRVPRNYFLKKMLFVNSNIARTSRTQTKTYYCLRYVYFNVLGRRRSRTLLSGNVGSIKTILDFPRRRSLFSGCEPGQSSSNQICIANRGRRDTFQYRLTTKLKIYSINPPTFVAFTM